MAERIAKFLANCGTASRRGAEEMISQGRVAVNGVVISSPVTFVNADDNVTVDGKSVTPNVETELYMFFKPINTMTTVRDPEGRKTIYDCLDKKYKNLKYVGRLDFKTTGLLLLTNDGKLARKLTLPATKIPRTYIATVKEINQSGILRAKQGVTVDEINYAPMKISVIDNNNLRITIYEGKKNEVRIVLRECGMPVQRLHRISYGDIKLENIKVGEIKRLNQKTIDEIKKSL